MSTKTTLLGQAVATTVGRSAQATKDLTEVYHLLQKSDLFTGHEKVFNPTKLDERGDPVDPQPNSSKAVQQRVPELLEQMSTIMSRHIDAAATRDWGNTLAKADVIVDGVTMVKEAPVPFLLFLEQQLQELHTTAQKLPTLSLDKSWAVDQNTSLYVSDPVITNRERKEETPVVAIQPTEHHKGEWTMASKSVITGQWSHTDFSGAISETQKKAIIDRIRKVKEAVVSARERANSTEVPVQELASPLLDYCLFDISPWAGATVHAPA